MAIPAFEGIVEDGRIRLADEITLPEHAKVYVIRPEPEIRRPVQIRSPRLAHPEPAADLVKQIIEVPPDAEL